MWTHYSYTESRTELGEDLWLTVALHFLVGDFWKTSFALNLKATTLPWFGVASWREHSLDTWFTHTQNSTLWLDYSPVLCCENTHPQTHITLKLYCIIHVFAPTVPGEICKAAFLSAFFLCLILNIISVAAPCDFCAAYSNAACDVSTKEDREKIK